MHAQMMRVYVAHIPSLQPPKKLALQIFRSTYINQEALQNDAPIEMNPRIILNLQMDVILTFYAS